MSEQNPGCRAEFAPFETELARPAPASPSLQMDFIEAHAANPKANAEVVRRHHEQLFEVGSRRHVLTALLSRIEKMISKRDQELAACAHRKEGHDPEVAVDTGERVVLPLGARISSWVWAGSSVGLLLVGWLLLTITFHESGIESFESWGMASICSLLPGLGITFGWKSLGALQSNAEAQQRYWRHVTKLGLFAGAAWLLFLALTIGADAFGGELDVEAAPAFDEEFDSGGGAAGGYGIWIVVFGVLAETLLAAASWAHHERQEEERTIFEMRPDGRFVTEEAHAAEHNAWLTEAVKIRGALQDGLERLDCGAKLFGERAVVALTPIWRLPPGAFTSPEEGASPHPLSHSRPGVSGAHSNGSQMEKLS